MKVLKTVKAAHPMYYVSLLYLVFPLYYALEGSYPFYVLPMTLAFALVYLGLVVTDQEGLALLKSELWINLFWLYLCFYVAFLTFRGNPMISMFNFYLSNILTWRFQEDKSTSFRHLVFYGVILFALYPILTYPVLETKVFLLTMDVICLGMMFIMKQTIKREQMEKKLNEQNASINLLLAENERNRIGQDLHDTLGHVFAMLTVKSELALTLLEKGAYDKAEKEVADLREISQTSMQEVRQIVQALKQHSLSEELLYWT